MANSMTLNVLGFRVKAKGAPMNVARNIVVVCAAAAVLFWGGISAEAQQAALKQGTVGSEVSVLQAQLQEYGYYQGSVDGVFGSGTRAALVSFQADCGLETDGVAGTATWQALRSFKKSEVSRGSSSRWRGQQITSYAQQFLGVPYVWAGRSPSGFDCSGFVSYVLGQNGVYVPRMADEQYAVGAWVNRGDLQPGDLVFFTTYEPGPSHVGIYTGNDYFIHASSGAGEVVVTSLNSSYYRARYLGARRLL